MSAACRLVRWALVALTLHEAMDCLIRSETRGKEHCLVSYVSGHREGCRMLTSISHKPRRMPSSNPTGTTSSLPHPPPSPLNPLVDLLSMPGRVEVLDESFIVLEANDCEDACCCCECGT